MRIENLECIPETMRIPLAKALSIRRSDGSLLEASFAAWLAYHCSQYAELVMIDSAGNLHFKTPGESQSLFIAHIDTVHHDTGANPYEIELHSEKAVPVFIQKPSGEKDSWDCLGADNGAGVTVLVHMIAHQVPGYYIFSRGEECGGVGAKHLADKFDNLLSTFKRAVTFDRRGTDSIITHQGGTRGCSDKFCEALSEAFAEQGMLYSQDKTGVYTDTREFFGLIPECTNLSAGYYSEHGSKERLSIWHMVELAQAVINIDWESLPVDRTPMKEPRYGRYGGYRGYTAGRYDEDEYDYTGITHGRWDTGGAANTATRFPESDREGFKSYLAAQGQAVEEVEETSEVGIGGPITAEELQAFSEAAKAKKREAQTHYENAVRLAWQGEDMNPLHEMIAKHADEKHWAQMMPFLEMQDISYVDFKMASRMSRGEGLDYLYTVTTTYMTDLDDEDTEEVAGVKGAYV